MSIVSRAVRKAIGNVNVERLLRARALLKAREPGIGIFRIPKFIAADRVRITAYGRDGFDTFFGYYDKCPQSADGTKILAGMTKAVRVGEAGQSLMTVGYFDDADPSRFTPLGETVTWCWQQGCMLGWLDSGDSHVIFNTMIGGVYGSRIVDVRTGKTQAELAWPVYSVAPSGKQALSCCFSRLHRLRRGYGYPQLKEVRANDAMPGEDGVWLVDIGSGAAKLLHSAGEVARISPHASMDGAEHYINHLKFNDTGDRFLFFHLWVKNGRQFSRMFTSSADGKLFLLSDRYVSHYAWRDDKTVVVYGEGPSGGCAYNEYEDFVGYRRNLFPFLNLPDGHGTFSVCDKILLTDTYPDALGFQQLYLIPDACVPTRVGRFFHPVRLNFDKRCDLHPRWGRSGKDVFLDTAAWGRRRIIKLDVSQVLSELSEAPGTRPGEF